MKNFTKIILVILSALCLGVLPSCDEAPDSDVPRGGFTLKGQVTAVGEKIEVEVYDSEYAFGPYWVITPYTTAYFAQDGTVASRADIKVGDKVEIEYGGQVMQSYPPQIVAKVIRIIV